MCDRGQSTYASNDSLLQVLPIMQTSLSWCIHCHHWLDSYDILEMSPAFQHLLNDDLVAPKERALFLQFNKLCFLSFPQGIYPVIWPSLSGIQQSTPFAFQEFRDQRELWNYDIFSRMISNRPTDAQTESGCASTDIYGGSITVYFSSWSDVSREDLNPFEMLHRTSLYKDALWEKRETLIKPFFYFHTRLT